MKEYISWKTVFFIPFLFLVGGYVYYFINPMGTATLINVFNAAYWSFMTLLGFKWIHSP